MNNKTETVLPLSNALYALTVQWFKDAAKLDNAGSESTSRLERAAYFAAGDRMITMALQVRKILREQEEAR
jgi:hypothetical protein